MDNHIIDWFAWKLTRVVFSEGSWKANQTNVINSTEQYYSIPLLNDLIVMDLGPPLVVDNGTGVSLAINIITFPS